MSSRKVTLPFSFFFSISFMFLLLSVSAVLGTEELAKLQNHDLSGDLASEGPGKLSGV